MKQGLGREMIALRASKEIKLGMYCNLGIGIPTLISDFLPPEIATCLHAENGILGYGPIAEGEKMDHDLVNASVQPITLWPGTSIFSMAEAFAMVRGGHVDMTILGAYQVSEKGDLANYSNSTKFHLGIANIGGSMDIACGVKRVIVTMEHTRPSGDPKIVKKCNLPVTAKGVVNTIITNLAVIEVTPDGLLLKELAPGISLDEVKSATEPKLIISKDLKEIEL